MLIRPMRDEQSCGSSRNGGEPSPRGSENSDHAATFHFVQDDSSEDFVDGEDWGVVSDDGTHVGSIADFRNGVLIVSGSEASSDGYPRYNFHRRHSPTSQDLSLPGTDSVPTDLDSLGLQTYGKHEPSDEGSSIPNRDDLSLEEAMDTDTSVWSSEFWTKPKNLRLVTKGCAFFLVALLVWDRYSLQHSKTRLEQEVRQLQREQEAYRAENQTQILRQKISNVRLPKFTDGATWVENDYDEHDNGFASGDGTWYDDDYTHFEDILLADNCWVRAKASVSFGNCASDAKEAIKDWSTRAFDSFEFFGTSVKDKFTTITLQAFDHNPFEGIPFQKAGISIEAVTEATTAVAHAAVKASEAVSKAVTVVDDSILQFIDVARDAIDEATASVRLDLNDE